MKYFRSCLMIFASFLFFSFGTNRPEKTSVTKERVIEAFSLNDIYGNKFSLSSYHGDKGCIVVFTCNHCPFATLYQDRLNTLNRKYKDLGFPLIAVNSISAEDFPEESTEALKTRAAEKSYNFLYLVDGEQKIAKLFGAAKTPHAFVLSRKENHWIVQYNGAIDDNGAEPAKVQNAYVENAIDELLNGKDISVKETKSIGCAIKFKNKPI